MEKYLEDRKNAHLKKRLDASIRAKMLPILSSFVSSTDIQVFVLPFQGRISVQGVESLWGDCRFIPADCGSQ